MKYYDHSVLAERVLKYRFTMDFVPNKSQSTSFQGDIYEKYPCRLIPGHTVVVLSYGSIGLSTDLVVKSIGLSMDI